MANRQSGVSYFESETTPIASDKTEEVIEMNRGNKESVTDMADHDLVEMNRSTPLLSLASREPQFSHTQDHKYDKNDHDGRELPSPNTQVVWTKKREGNMRRSGYECPVCDRFHYTLERLEECLQQNDDAREVNTNEDLVAATEPEEEVIEIPPPIPPPVRKSTKRAAKKLSFTAKKKKTGKHNNINLLKDKSNQVSGKKRKTRSDSAEKEMPKKLKKVDRKVAKQKDPKTKKSSSSSSSDSVVDPNSWKDWNRSTLRLDRKLNHFPMLVSKKTYKNMACKSSTSDVSMKCVLCQQKCKVRCACCQVFLHPAQLNGGQDGQPMDSSCWAVFHSVENFNMLPNVVFMPVVNHST